MNLVMGRHRSSLDKDFEQMNPSKENKATMLQKKQSNASPSTNIRYVPHTHDMELPISNNKHNNQKDIPELFKPRRRSAMSDWPDEVEFDEEEDVLTIDAEGNLYLVKNLIQPHDVWHANGVKYFVSFNEYYQPLKKGGHILVRFIGDVAKNERFCPIRETNWHHVNDQFKVDIVKLIRARFVIPDGDFYDQGILKRAGNSMRQYRHSLKKKLFKPTTMTKAQIYQSAPTGHPRDSWIYLVDYWYSEKGKRFSDCGKEARALQNHAHTTGAKSYANIRASFV
ncbi:hypothetical protein KSS87_012201 [Heliosperma pusillum]|nr:hypothetical protein KSS87_012201 [Heliosperma pusillum]